MEIQELVTNFGLTVDKADLVLEYLKETGSKEDYDVFNAVMTVNNVCNKHSEITNNPATCANIQNIYSALPHSFTKVFGDKYLVGYTEFLLRGGII